MRRICELETSKERKQMWNVVGDIHNRQDVFYGNPHFGVQGFYFTKKKGIWVDLF